MDNDGILCKFFRFPGNPVAETHPDGKQHVTPAHRHIRSVPPVNSQVPHIQRMIRGQRPHSHNRRDNRNPRLFRQRSHLLPGAGGPHSSPGQEKRALCPTQAIQQCLHPLPGNPMAAAPYTVSFSVSSFHRQSFFTPGIQTIPQLPRIRVTPRSLLDILRQIHHHNSRPPRPGDAKCFSDGSGKLLPPSHRNRIFGDAFYYAEGIHFLERPITDQARRNLPGKTDKGHTVVIGSGNPRHKVRRPRPACHKAYTHLPGRAGVPVRSMDKPLFVAGKDDIDSLHAIQRVKQINHLPSRISKQRIHLFTQQCFHKNFCSRNLHILTSSFMYACTCTH